MSDSDPLSPLSHDEAPTIQENRERLLLPGTQVGDYVVEQPLGEGGFGTVYRANHPLIGKRAAVKVLNRDLSSDPEMVARFVAEARAVNTIRHQNIVDIFNIGSLPDGRHYFVMELLDGQSLEDVLCERTRITPGELVTIMRGVAGALEAAHQNGIVHRDLKPDNIFLHRAANGLLVPKLVDFGVAKLTGQAKSLSSHQTSTGTPIGTPRYMSPEQCFAHDIDSRTDIYAFGVVCFEALTGMAPFDADSLLVLMNLHTSAPRPNASEVCPALGPAFDEVLKQMMSIDPLHRPGTALEAFALLERAALLSRREGQGDTPTTVASLPQAPANLPQTPANLPQAPANQVSRAPDFDAAITLPTPARGTVVATTHGGPSLAIGHKPHTLGATTSSMLVPRKSSKRWIILAASLFGLVGVAGAAIYGSGSAVDDPSVEPAREGAPSEVDSAAHLPGTAPGTDSAPNPDTSTSVADPTPSSPAASTSATPTAPSASAPAPKPLHTVRRPVPSPPPVKTAKPDPFSFP